MEILISPRRTGKSTMLIKKVVEIMHTEKNAKCVIITVNGHMKIYLKHLLNTLYPAESNSLFDKIIFCAQYELRDIRLGQNISHYFYDEFGYMEFSNYNYVDCDNSYFYGTNDSATIEKFNMLKARYYNVHYKIYKSCCNLNKLT